MTTAHSTVEPERQYQDENGEWFSALARALAKAWSGLPADDDEFKRLDVQHDSYKSFLHGKNYAGPVADALGADAGGRVKRGLDIGAGSGAWAIEMAKEFSDAEWTGADLILIKKDYPLPPNLKFVQQDIMKENDFKDGQFDVVHSRALIAGIRDWPAYIEEVVRITRPGGLILLDEGAFPILGLDGQDVPDLEQTKPGLAAISRMALQAWMKGGFDPAAGAKTIPHLLKQHKQIEASDQFRGYIPIAPAAELTEEHKRLAGEYMKTNMINQTGGGRRLLTEQLGISNEEYDQIVTQFLQDLDTNPPLTTSFSWNWAWKKQ